MIPAGTIVEESYGVWRIHLTPREFPPLGKISSDSFPSYEAAAEAYRNNSWK